MTRCQKCGAKSETTDYCDQCGAALASMTSVASDNSPEAPAPVTLANVLVERAGACPACGSTREPLELFCEHCGFDFLTGTTPPPPPPPPPTATDSANAVPKSRLPAEGALKAWELEIAVDLGRWNAQATLHPDATAAPAATVVALVTATVQIGRRSASRKINPDIDLSQLTGDPAVSHSHAQLSRSDDGRWWLRDLKSANGTSLGGNPVGEAAQVLSDGDLITLGAWTTISVASR